MIGIYCIINQVNGKKYVGQSRNIESRFKSHMSCDAKLKTELGEAIRKYGKENFYFIILQECQINELDELERFWIKKLDTYTNGYNMTFGGRDQIIDYSSVRAIPINEVKKSWEEGKCIKEIISKYGCSSHNAVKNQLLELGYTEDQINKRGKNKRNSSRSRKVKQFTLEGEFVQTFTSLNEAGRVLNISSQNIGKVCKGIRKQCGGFIWRYEEE